MKGTQIKTAKQLLKEKSVWIDCWKKKCIPVAMLQNMQFRMVNRLLGAGYIYKYIKK